MSKSSLPFFLADVNLSKKGRGNGFDITDLLVSKSVFLLLLNNTYKKARLTCDFYKNNPLKSISKYSDLSRLPLIDRQHLISNIQSVTNRRCKNDSFSATSGTTTGQSLFIPRSTQETSNLVQYRSWLESHINSNSKAGHNLVLRLLPGGRFLPGGIGNNNELIAVYNMNMARENLWDNWDNHISNLFVDYELKGRKTKITTIHSTPPCGLVMLTRYMVSRGVDPADTSVRNLVVTGSSIPIVKRKWLEQIWNANLITTYSCSELNGWAYECHDTPYRYHFNHTIFPEVLSKDKNEHVGEGKEGRLALTGLHPFHHACYLMRYLVGDWVRWVGFQKCSCGVLAPTIDFLGRQNNVLFLENRSEIIAISPLELLEEVEKFQFIPDIPKPQLRLTLIRERDIPILVLQIECFSVGDENWQSKVKKLITDAILASDSKLSRLLKEKVIDFEIVLFGRSGLSVSLDAR